MSGNTCIYIHNTCKYNIYIRIHAYTYIYTYMNFHAVDAMHVYWKQQYTCRYMHIHAYTYIYLFPTYIFSEYVYFLFIRTYTAYTCIYMQCEKWCFCTGSQKNNFPYRKYVNIRVYCHIHAIYDTYTYNIRHNILQYTYKINQ